MVRKGLLVKEVKLCLKKGNFDSLINGCYAMRRYSLYWLYTRFSFRKGLIFLFITILIFTACKKEGTAVLNVHLTDAPVLGLDAVYLDLQAIEVNSSEKETEKGWRKLNMEAQGAFNLLSYVNGKDTLIASGTFPPGKISQIRLIPGPDNSVIEGGKNYTLSVTSILANGIRLSLPLELKADRVYEVWVDVDASRSLVRKPNNQFNLEPVARTFINTGTGSVSGTINPSSTNIYVRMVAGTDTIGTIPGETGDFLIRGIQPGTWSFVLVGPEAGEESNSQEVVVLADETNQLGTILLTGIK
jgi:hypothetical protein